ncbi:MAG: hypothetical protein JNL11_17655 [Bdellovibrionaceae bacterium]|nr:hypothetical protein [Pseudobdellovibrionaceae bacterium]
MKYTFFLLLILFTVVGRNLAFANACGSFYGQEQNKPVSNGVEKSTFSGISKDLSQLVGNDKIATAMSNLTSKAGLRLQVAYITGEIGRGHTADRLIV